MKTVFLATAIAAVCLGSFAHAQTKTQTRYYAEGAVPTPIDVARAIAGPQFTPKLKMRGLAVPAAAPSSSEEMVAIAAIATSANATTATPVAPAASQRASTTIATTPQSPAANAGVLAMAVPFAFDSARLAPTAAPMLDSVAEGIKLLGDGNKIVIEGHTDSVGNPAYNARLSKHRAQAVKRYFVAQHGIRPSVLITQGKGSREPLSGMKPIANENRRVQFRLG
jgi:outer membrane protein OmpA-like peptidoglycan-associated protein